MKNETRYDRFNKKLPVLCFRADPELKEILIKYGHEMGYIDKESGIVNMNKTLHEIVEDYLIIQGVLKLKYEATI